MDDLTLLDFYDRRLPEYDGVYQLAERQADLRTLKALVAESLAGRRVLELACGTGYWTVVVAETAELVTATDASRKALDYARDRVTAPNVAFERLDAFQPEAISGEFSAVLAAFWLSHVRRSDLPVFLERLQRRMKSGTRVVLMDNRYVEGSSTPTAERDSEGNTYQLRRLQDGTEYKLLKNFLTVDELEDAARLVGREVEVRELEYYWFLRLTLEAKV